MAVAASYDETLRFGAQTPFSDQMTYRWEGGKWEYDRDHNSIITAGNGGTKPIRASFTIFYDRGAKKYEIEQALQPDDQMWIDIGEIIQRQVPDKIGNTLPLDLSSGSYQFNDLTDHAIGSLFEGKVMYDKTFGHVSYGCASCCGSLGTPWFSPSPLDVYVSLTGQADVIDNDGCDGYQSSVLYGFTSWSSANTAVATIARASALVTGSGIGSASQQSPGSVTIGGSDFKRCRFAQYTPSGPATVSSSKVVSVIASTCFQVNGTGSSAYVPFTASYGTLNGACTITANLGSFTPSTGSCVQHSNVNCWQTASGNCTTLICPLPTRTVDGGCTMFVDGVPVGTSSSTSCVK